MSAEKIAATLETDIVSGIFRPGEELKQGELAARFSVSRIPVRDALQLMAARGLIDLERNRRARVISLTHAEIDEVYHLRVLLETDCLRQSIRRLEADDLAKIGSSPCPLQHRRGNRPVGRRRLGLSQEPLHACKTPKRAGNDRGSSTDLPHSYCRLRRPADTHRQVAEGP